MHFRQMLVRSVATVLVLPLVGSSCSAQEADQDRRPVEAIPTCRIVQHGTRLPKAVEETSGVAVSRVHLGIYWTHNDRGGDAHVFAVDASGELRGTVEIRGAEAKDWEDIALGPCPAGTCLYIADTGSNREKRKEIALYRVPEPSPAAAKSVRAESFPAQFPGDPQDTEALFENVEAAHLQALVGQQPAAIIRGTGVQHNTLRLKRQVVASGQSNPGAAGTMATAEPSH